MKYLAILLFAVMAISHTLCGCLLWQKREATGDRSRTILALIGWASAFMAVLYIFRTFADTLPVGGPLLAPGQVFFPFGWLMFLLLYPLELIQPVVDRANLYLLMFAPLVLMFILGICAGVAYTPLLSVDDLWMHIGQADVWFRLLALAVLPFYGFVLCGVRFCWRETYTPLLSVGDLWQHIGRPDVGFRFLALAVLPFYGFVLCGVRYCWRETYTDKAFLRLFACVLCLIGLLQAGVQLTLSYGLFLLQGAVWMLFFFGLTWYELYDRLWVRRTDRKFE